MSLRRVAVTGLGLISPFGGDLDDFFMRIAGGESAVRSYAPADAPQAVDISAVHCPAFDGEAAVGRAVAHSMDRYAQMGAAAAYSAWNDAGLPEDGEERTDAGVTWGTAVGGVMTYDHGYRDLYINGRSRVSPLSVVLGMNNSVASHIAIHLGLAGLCITYSVACASSAMAVGEAFRRIREGEVTTMVAGGSDAPLALGVIRAWEALRVLAPTDGEATFRACRPFSADRGGLVLGEGAGALVLEEWSHAEERGARIYGELAGYGTTCDHSHLVRPAPAGQVRAMRQAIADAGIAPEAIDYVNAHGTATREGDPAEIAAIRTLFGDRAAEIPVSATKSMHGHQMGASGAVEAIITVLALHRDLLPPTAHLQTLDPTCGGVRHITGTALAGSGARYALSNSFAFGGSNAALVFRGR